MSAQTGLERLIELVSRIDRFEKLSKYDDTDRWQIIRTASADPQMLSEWFESDAAVPDLDDPQIFNHPRYQIAKRSLQRARKAFIKDTRRHQGDESLSDKLVDQSLMGLNPEAMAQVEDGISHLDEMDRQIVELAMQGRSIKKIVEAVGLERHAIGKRLKRIRDALTPEPTLIGAGGGSVTPKATSGWEDTDESEWVDSAEFRHDRELERYERRKRIESVYRAKIDSDPAVQDGRHKARTGRPMSVVQIRRASSNDDLEKALRTNSKRLKPRPPKGDLLALFKWAAKIKDAA